MDDLFSYSIIAYAIDHYTLHIHVANPRLSRISYSLALSLFGAHGLGFYTLDRLFLCFLGSRHKEEET